MTKTTNNQPDYKIEVSIRDARKTANFLIDRSLPYEPQSYSNEFIFENKLDWKEAQLLMDELKIKIINN